MLGLAFYGGSAAAIDATAADCVIFRVRLAGSGGASGRPLSVYASSGSLFIHFGFAAVVQHIEGVERQCLHLVFAGIAVDGGEEADALAQTADEIVRAHESAGEQYGVYLATEHGALGSDILGHLIDHGVDHQFGVLVTTGYAALDFLHVVGAEVAYQSSLSGYALEQFLLGELAAEAEAYQVGCRQRTGTLGREGSLAIEGVVGVYGTAFLVGGDRDAATHVADDEVEVFIAAADLLGITAADGALVEGMPDADAVHQGRATDAGKGRQLVYHTRVGDEGTATGYHACYLVGHDAAQVAGVFVDGLTCVVEHLLIDFVHTTRDGLGETATAYHSLEEIVDVHALELVDDELAAEIILVGDFVKLRQLFHRVANGAQHDGGGVLIHGYLGRGRAGIDD